MDTKQTQKTRGLQIKPFQRKLASKLAKIDQNRPKFMDDPKIFRKFFFSFLESTYFNSCKNAIKNFRPLLPFMMVKKFRNGPIRKVVIIKMKFEDLRIFFTTRSTWLYTQKIFQNLFDFFLLKKFLNGPIRKVMLKVGFEDLQIFSPLPGHPGSTLRKLLQKVSKWFNLQSYVRIDT